jgi:23S rRNA U2552 (ribose-2'-O)-methylase RlmE/FtsJ
MLIGDFIPVSGFMQLKLFFSQVTFAKPKSSRNSSIGKSYSLQKKFHTRAPYMLSQP